jgi:hypothetical protein
MLNMRRNSVRAPAVREIIVDRKELIQGRGREGELIEADNKINPHIGCRRVKRC